MKSQKELLNDPEVKRAIRLLVVRGITPKQVEEAYRYFDRIKEKREEVNMGELGI